MYFNCNTGARVSAAAGGTGTGGAGAGTDSTEIGAGAGNESTRPRNRATEGEEASYSIIIHHTRSECCPRCCPKARSAPGARREEKAAGSWRYREPQ